MSYDNSFYFNNKEIIIMTGSLYETGHVIGESSRMSHA